MADFMHSTWLTSAIDSDTIALARDIGLSPITARVLINRGITGKEQARTYLDPVLSDIPDPLLIPKMDMAVDRIIRAITKKEQIAIFGDYDVDGVTATALLVNFLSAAGARPIWALPHRMREGYGLTINAIDEFRSKNASLIITVDNGTRAVEEVKHASSFGIDVIVTDHHDTDSKLPAALAVINPKLLGPSSPHSDLAGVGVAFMLILALRKKLRGLKLFSGPEPNLRQHLDLVAMGTIADVMPLTGINRILVKHGIREIAFTSKIGLKALIDISGTNVQKLTPEAIAFQIAPRINAAGRVGDAVWALELLLGDEPVKAAEIAAMLDSHNRERQKMEQRILLEANKLLQSDPDFEGRSSIVLARENWHVGVVGIAAAKVAERFGKPAVILSKDVTPAKGSARGISGLNLVDILSECRAHLVRFGGHAMAAGLSVNFENIDGFSAQFDDVCKRHLPSGYAKSLSIDARVALSDINQGLVDELSLLAPYGAGNREPIFAADGLKILNRRILSEKHLKLKVGAQNLSFDAIGFNMADRLPDSVNTASLAFTPEFNTWNGITSIQLRIKDIHV